MSKRRSAHSQEKRRREIAKQKKRKEKRERRQQRRDEKNDDPENPHPDAPGGEDPARGDLPGSGGEDGADPGHGRDEDDRP